MKTSQEKSLDSLVTKSDLELVETKLDAKIDSLEERISKAGVTVKIQNQEKPIWVMADARKISQVLINLIINAISIWNTVYLSQAIEHFKTTGKYQEELLPHISPLGWEHINFLGEYSFIPEILSSIHSLRPLRI